MASIARAPSLFHSVVCCAAGGRQARWVVLVLAGLAGSSSTAFAQAPRRPSVNPPAPTPVAKAEESGEMDAEHKAADEANQRGEYTEVIRLASILLAKDEKDYFALHLRASAKIELGRQSRDTKSVRDGVADARAALAIAGKKAVWLFVPYVYGMTTLAEIESRPEHAKVAIDVLAPVLARKDLSPSDRANLLYQRGLANFSRRELDSALADFLAATGEVSTHAGALIKTGEAYAAMNKPEEALKAYDRAVEAAPSNIVVLNDRGAYRRFRANLQGALEDFSKCLELNPGFSMGYLNRGITLYDLGQYEGAESDLTKALEAKIQPTLAHRLRGNARMGRGQTAAAMEDFAAAIALVPSYAAAYEDRGVAKLIAKDFAGAAEDFRQSIKHNPQQALAYCWLSVAVARAGDAGAAITSVEPVVKKTVPSADWVMALAQFLQGSLDEAALREAAKVGPEGGLAARTCEAEYFIGQKKLIAGDMAGAAENFKQAVATGANLMSAHRAARYETGDAKPAS
jgi:lipoprotein NlpI